MNQKYDIRFQKCTKKHEKKKKIESDLLDLVDLLW